MSRLSQQVRRVYHDEMTSVASAVRQRDRREALGQVLRIVVAAPGSLAGKYPDGNTGRTSAGLTTPTPIPPDLAEVLAGGKTNDRYRR